MWYVRDELYDDVRLSEIIKNHRENRKYAPGIEIDHNVKVSEDPAEVAKLADVILFAYATRHVHEILEVIKPFLKPDVLFISFSKVSYLRCFTSMF